MVEEFCWYVASFFQNHVHGACLILKKRGPFICFLFVVEFLLAHHIALRLYLTIVVCCINTLLLFVSKPYDILFSFSKEIVHSLKSDSMKL
jgi:hypothetical protein